MSQYNVGKIQDENCNFNMQTSLNLGIFDNLDTNQKQMEEKMEIVEKSNPLIR